MLKIFKQKYDEKEFPTHKTEKDTRKKIEEAKRKQSKKNILYLLKIFIKYNSCLISKMPLKNYIYSKNSDPINLHIYEAPQISLFMFYIPLLCWFFWGNWKNHILYIRFSYFVCLLKGFANSWNEISGYWVHGEFLIGGVCSYRFLVHFWILISKIWHF